MYKHKESTIKLSSYNQEMGQQTTKVLMTQYGS